MDGGVVKIRFEADTSKIDSSIKKITSSVDKINLSKYKAETARIRAEAQKLNAEIKQSALVFEKSKTNIKEMKAQAELLRAQFNMLHPELAKDRLEIEKISAEASKTRAEAQKLRQENIANGKITENTVKDTGSLYLKYRLVREICEAIVSIIKGLAQGMKDATKFALSFTKAMLSVANPLGALSLRVIKMSGALDKIKSLFSWNGLESFAKSAIEASSALTEVQNIVDVAFPNMTREMNDWATNTINKFGLSEKSAKQYSATLGLMAQSAGLAEEASFKLGTGLTAVTADLASMYNMDTNTVYEKIRSGVIGGRTAAIAQLGINMNQSNLQAYLTSKGIEANYSALDNATKTAIRYNYVIEQTRKIQGDFTKTSGTWANQTRILAQNIEQLKASLGVLLISVLTPIIQRINQLIQILTPAIDKMKTFLQTLGITIQTPASSGSGLSDYTDGLEELGNTATETGKKITALTDGPFSEMHKLGKDDLGSTADALKNAFGGSLLLDYQNPYIVEEVKEVDTWLTRLLKKLDFSKLLDEIKRSIDLVKGWIESIKTAWNNAWNKDNQGIKWLQSIIDLSTQVLSLANDISEAFKTMWDSGWGEKLFDHMLTTATKLNETVKGIVDKIKNAWNSGSGHYGDVKNGDKTENRELTRGEYLAESFYKLSDSALSAADSIIDFVGEVFDNVDWDQALDGITTFINDLSETLDNLGNWLDEHPDVAKKLGEIITDVLSNPGAILETVAAIKLVGPALEGVGKVLGILAAKKLFFGGATKAGASAAGGASAGGGGLLANILPIGVLVAGVTELGSIIYNAATDVFPEVTERIKRDGFKGLLDADFWLNEVPDKLRGPISTAFANFMIWLIPKIGDLITTASDFIKGKVEEVTTKISEKIHGFVEELQSNFKEKWDELWNKLPEPVQKALDFIGGLVEKIVNKVRSAANTISSLKSGALSGASAGAIKVANSVSKKVSGHAITTHANGGVFLPNRPHLAVLGDNTRDTEYALTETHLDLIADKITGAIMNGMMRMNSGVSGSGSQVINVQVGNESFKDYIVQTIDEHNYRR